MKLKIEIDESEAEEIMELARELAYCVESLKKQIKEFLTKAYGKALRS